MWFPIFQIVRVPARFSIFIILSLSMLASFRLDALLKKPRSWVLTIIILVIFLMEVWQKNTPFVSIPEKNAIPKVYSWLRAQPEPVVIAELPISLFYHGTMMENQLYTSYA